MDMYSHQRLARIEHEGMVRSLPIIHEFDDPFPPGQSRWSRLTAGLRAIAARLQTSPRNQ